MSDRPRDPKPETLALLRCPRTGEAIEPDGADYIAASGAERYGRVQGVVDLRRAPERITLDLPWFEPWEDIDRVDFQAPPAVEADDLPFHLDGHQAAVVESYRREYEGSGPMRALEIGCGERAAEPFFVRRGYHYVGTDVDVRGQGPHLLCDAHALPFSDETFDLYYAMAVYEHLVCPHVAALEAHRVLKPGGLAFGSAAFIFGFHDRASFFHLSHGGLVALLRTVGFEDVRVWPGWGYTESIPSWAFNSKLGLPWRVAMKAAMTFGDFTYTKFLNLARRATGRTPVDLRERQSQIAGGLNFVARKGGR